MGASFSMNLPEGIPDPMEPISSFAYARGNVMTAVEEVGFRSPCDQTSSTQAQCALSALIAELDKGEDGTFNTSWWVETDMKWSKGAEFTAFCDQWNPLLPTLQRSMGRTLTIQQWYARNRRDKLREDAFRWFSYYRMGITFEWHR